jgi:hypothetical protein
MSGEASMLFAAVADSGFPFVLGGVVVATGEGVEMAPIVPLGVGRGSRTLPLVGVLRAENDPPLLVGVVERPLRGVGSLNLDRRGVVVAKVLRGGGPLSLRAAVVRGGDSDATGGSRIFGFGFFVAASTAAAAATAPANDDLLWLLIRGVSEVASVVGPEALDSCPFPLLLCFLPRGGPGDAGGVTLCRGGVVPFAEEAPLSIVSSAFGSSAGAGGGCENRASGGGDGFDEGRGFPNTGGVALVVLLSSGVGGGCENMASGGGGLGDGGGFPNTAGTADA